MDDGLVWRSMVACSLVSVGSHHDGHLQNISRSHINGKPPRESRVSLLAIPRSTNPPFPPHCFPALQKGNPNEMLAAEGFLFSRSIPHHHQLTFAHQRLVRGKRPRERRAILRVWNYGLNASSWAASFGLRRSWEISQVLFTGRLVLPSFPHLSKTLAKRLGNDGHGTYTRASRHCLTSSTTTSASLLPHSGRLHGCQAPRPDRRA